MQQTVSDDRREGRGERVAEERVLAGGIWYQREKDWKEERFLSSPTPFSFSARVTSFKNNLLGLVSF